jgi:hypothetical protein
MKRRINNGDSFDSSRIISTNDIFLSTDVSSSLSDKIEEQDEEINKLKKWTKWYVKYGGMGSGGGSGSGSGGSGSFGHKIYFKDSSMVKELSGDVLNLWGPGTYTVSFNLTRTQGHSFTIKYRISDGAWITKLISEGNSSLDITLQLKVKVIFTYQIIDNATDDETGEVSKTIIPESFSIDPKLNYRLGGTVQKNGAVNFPVVTEGLCYRFAYTIYETIEVFWEVRYKLETDSIWHSIAQGSFPFSDSGENISGVIDGDIDLSDVLDEENSIGKSITFELIYGMDRNTYTATPAGTTTISIIPLGYYILLTDVNDQLYLNQPSPSQYNSLNKLKKGYLPFYISLCSGSDANFPVYVSIYSLVDDSWVKVGNTVSSSLQTNTTYSISDRYKITVVDPGLYKIVASTNQTGTEYPTTKYFYVREDASSWNFKHYEQISNRSSDHTYFTDGADSPMLNNPVTYYLDSFERDINTSSLSGINKYNYNIALGIQYDSSNDDNDPFIELSGNSDRQYLRVYQNKITYGDTKIIEDYYFPKTVGADETKIENWHLLNININFIRQTVSGQSFYEFTVYIDGVIEGVSKGIVNNSNSIALSYDYKYSKIKINPNKNQIIKLNLFDINLTSISDSILFDKASADNECYRKYNYLYDIYATTYYNRYRNYLGVDSIDIIDTSEFSKLIESFEFSEYGLPYTTSTTISDMITKKDANGSEKLLRVPILVLSPNETSSSLVGEGGFFKKWFLSPWPESPRTDDEKPSSINGYIYYVPKDSEGQLSDFIIRDDNQNKIGFTFSIQGSSTRGFGIKNIELSVNQLEEDRLTVFTPNFDKDDTSTFLPEKSFTLKADMVDSSTCNNNSIGDFINQNTKPLDENNCPARAASNPFKSHIKNCLTGFPVLVFINIDNAGGVNDTRFYYVGIYNFNLGRESYFNLGYYKNYSEFQGLITDPNQGEFKVLKVGTPSYADDLYVTEISNGDPFFDFSQYSTSILFSAQMDNPNGNPDDHSMFSYDDSIYSNQVKFKDLFLGAVRSISKAGGYIYEQLQKNFEKIGNYDQMVNLLHDENGVSYNCVSDYRVQYNRTPYESEFSEIPIQNPSATSDDLIDCIATTKIINDTSEPYTPYLDLRSTVEYYVICMAFGMVDSVLKNLELKAWNSKKIFPAFYDMDTALGVDNNGRNVSFFAFSDYWENSTTDLGNGTVKANGVEIYPDFFNKNQDNKGYDVPSSYLFAIAKYATMDLMGVNSLIPYIGNTEAGSSSNAPLSPVNLYSLFRKKGGDLESASTFMSKYFTKRLKYIPNSLKNLNYRAKYARVSNWLIDEFNYSNITDVINKTSIKVSDLSDLGKFNGTGINKKTDWLSSRLHLLDSYFNINESVKYRVRKADLTKNGQGVITGVTWSDIVKSDQISYWYYPRKSNINAIFGEDVTINDQIFYVLDGTKSALSIQNLLIKAPSYTPVVVQIAGHSPISYLIGDSTGETKFQIPINTTGDQLWGIYGSKTFNYINNLGLFKLSDSSISSSNLKSVSYLPSDEIGNSKSTNFTLNTPNIDSVTITGNNYGGSLTFDDKLTYNRLNTIDLSESNITCICTNQLPVTSLNLQKIDCSQNTISFANLVNLTEVFLDDGKFSKLELPFWKQSISITTNSPEISATSGYDYHGVSVKTLNLINTKFTNSKLSLYDMPDLTDLIISDVYELYVYNCPNLENITISESLKKVSIIRCSTSTSVHNLSIGRTPSENLGKLDFSLCQNLTYLNMNQTLHFTVVDIGNNNVELPSSAFGNCTDLEYLDGSGNYILTGQSTFSNDYSFKLRSTGGGYPHVICKDGLKNISSEFYCSNRSGSVDFGAAKKFLELNRSKGVTNIDYLFYNQSNIGTSFTGFDSVDFEYLKDYTSITSANLSFAYCGINWWTKKLYNFGANSNVSIQGTFYCSEVNAQEDFLSNIGRKLSTYNDLGYNGASCYYTFYNNSSVPPKVTFYNVVRYLTNATTLYAFTSIRNSEVDLKDCFRDTTKFTTIYRLMYSGGNWSNLTYEITDAETGETRITSCYQCCSNLTNVGVSFSDTSSKSGRISLLNLFTENQWRTMSSMFTLGIPDYYTSQFSAGKTMTHDEYDLLLSYLKSNNSITVLGPIFKNCNITECETPPVININYTSNNTRITSLYHTFNGIKAYSTDGVTERAMKLDENFFLHLPNVSSILYAFANVWIGNESGLPFNFFKKRKEVIPTAAYYPNKETIPLETVNKSTYEYIYYRSTSDSSTIETPPNSSNPLKPLSTLISEDTNNTYYSNDASATNKWVSELPSDHADPTSVRFLVSRRAKPTRINSDYGNWESPRVFEKYENSTNKVIIYILDTTKYEYTYYSSTSLDSTIEAPTEIGDGTLSLSELAVNFPQIYTSTRSTNNKWITSTPNSPTDYTKRRFLISKRTKVTISGTTTYGNWDNPVVYDKFNEPIPMDVRYFTYPDTRLTDITGIFYRCKYTVPCWIYDYAAPGETSKFIEDNTSYIKDGSGNSYDKYYTTKDCSDTKLGSYRNSDEINDLQGVVCSTQTNVTVGGHQFVNFDLFHTSGSINSNTYYPFIPSDFFLGVVNGCKIENAFSSGTTESNSPAGSGYYTSVEGYIPKNLFGYNNINSDRISPSKMYNWIENANILPVRVGTTKNYSFVPRNFIKKELSDIKYLFNFHIRVPSYNREANDEDNYVFYVMYSDSINVSSNLVSFDNTLPRYVLHGGAGSAVVESASDGSIQNVCAGNYYFNYKLIVVPTSDENDQTIDGTEGKVDKYFPKASYEHFFSRDMLYVYCGTIWSEEIILNNLNNKGVNVFDGINVDSGGTHIGINRWCVFPITNNNFSTKNIFANQLNYINLNSIRGNSYTENWRSTYSGITFVS